MHACIQNICINLNIDGSVSKVMHTYIHTHVSKKPRENLTYVW